MLSDSRNGDEFPYTYACLKSQDIRHAFLYALQLKSDSTKQEADFFSRPLFPVPVSQANQFILHPASVPYEPHPIPQTNPIKFAQELLSTFSTSLGEVALIPSTGGVFTVDIVYAASQEPSLSSTAVTGEEQQRQPIRTQMKRLWDRKTEGGFPGE